MKISKNDEGGFWLVFKNVNNPPISNKKKNDDNGDDEFYLTVNLPAPPVRAKSVMVISWPFLEQAIDPYDDLGFIQELVSRNKDQIDKQATTIINDLGSISSGHSGIDLIMGELAKTLNQSHQIGMIAITAYEKQRNNETDSN